MSLKAKNRLSRLLFNPKFFSLVGFIIVLLIAMPLYRNFSQRYKVDQEIKNLEQEVLKLEKKNESLGGMIKYLESDAFIEEQARLNLGMKKPGEKVVIVEGEQAIKTPASQASSAVFRIPGLEKNQTKTIGNPERWFYYFFK